MPPFETVVRRSGKATQSPLFRTVLLTGLLLVLVGGQGPLKSTRPTVHGPSRLPEPGANEAIQNLRAFTKLYGYVRYFHPSDAAADLNWERFALRGVRQVTGASSRAELRTDLEDLFRPIAPTVQLYQTGEEPPARPDVLTPTDTAGLEFVAWQHRGVEFSKKSVPKRYRTVYDQLSYRSRRLNRGGEEGPLFDARPKPGRVINEPLGRGLSAQVPLALYSRDGQTLRPEGAPPASALRSALAGVQLDTISANHEALRLADVTIAWTIFQHFYPYFDVVSVDWDAVLTRTLRRARADTSSREFLRTLRRMVAQLGDGHGRVQHPADSATGLPLRVERAGDSVLVVDTMAEDGGDPCARPGDVVRSIGGTAVEKELRLTKQYISGSPQWKRYLALQRFGEGPPGTTVRLHLRRDGERVTCRVRRVQRSKERARRGQLQLNDRPDSVAALRPGIYYVDLTRVGPSGLRGRLDTLAQADGIVFDVRGYVEGGNQALLGHLSSRPLRSMRFELPQFIYPDQTDIVGYDTSGRRTLSPRQPRISGTVAFLTDARAISRSETFMSLVEHYELGEIVGQPTAGANGPINPFTLPGDYEVHWTGMRVRKHDGSPHHLVGIRPTVPVERTIEGIRQGRDDLLKEALSLVVDSTE